MKSQFAYNGFCIAILGFVLLAGCNTNGVGGTPEPASAEKRQKGHGHAHSEHSHAGPHGGHLIELGSNGYFHAELLHDNSTHRVTVYIPDGKGIAKVAVSQPELVLNIVSGGSPKQYKLAAVALANDPGNLDSCFQAEDEELCKELNATDLKGRLAVVIGGKQYVGEIEHHDHDHEHK